VGQGEHHRQVLAQRWPGGCKRAPSKIKGGRKGVEDQLPRQLRSGAKGKPRSTIPPKHSGATLVRQSQPAGQAWPPRCHSSSSSIDSMVSMGERGGCGGAEGSPPSVKVGTPQAQLSSPLRPSACSTGLRSAKAGLQTASGFRLIESILPTRSGPNSG